MRIGTMPIGVGGYDLYTKLLTAAPELSGKWAIAPLPGIKTENGKINRMSPGGESCIMI